MSGCRPLVMTLGATILVLAPAGPAAAKSEEGTIRAADEVLQQFLDLSVKQIPASLLADAHGVAIIPDVIKLGFVLGGQHGRGVVVIREKDGSWRAPLFVTLTGGSIGWQIGAQSTDFVLVFKTQRSVEGLMRGKFTLGADAAVAAGPVGRRAEAATDAELKAEIYSYSRTRGLFAGVSLDGSALQVDDAANSAYYGAAAPGAAPPPVPQSALKLVEVIARLTANPQAPPAATTAPAETRAATPADLRPRPTSDLEALQAELIRAMASLSPLLDDAWRRHLALPAEVFQKGRQPSPEALQTVLNRFQTVAQSPQYRALAQRREFQTVHGLLTAYQEVLGGSGVSKLALPPPPAGVPR